MSPSAALYDKAAEGDIQAAKEIGDRLDGKAPATMDITHHEGESVNDAQARNMAQEFLERAARTEGVGKGQLTVVHDSAET